MKRRFKVVFNREKCKGCELCINFCPKGILALDPEVNAKGYHRPASLIRKSASAAQAARPCVPTIASVSIN